MPVIEEYDDDRRFMLVDVDLGNLTKGQILTDWDREKEKDLIIPIKANQMREFVDEMRKFYLSDKKPTKAQFKKIFEKHQDKLEEQIHDTLGQLDKSPEKIFKVVKREKIKDGFRIEVKKIDDSDRVTLIRRICDKLINKLTKEQLKSLLEEGLKKNADVKELEEIDKELEKKEPVVETKKGCFKIKVNDKEVFVMY
jgi:hypothetical protein